MRIRLRQVALVASTLEPVETAIAETLGVELCFRDPGVSVFGLRNSLFPIGDQLLEVVSPIEDGTTAGRLLEKRGGDGGYMVILQVDDLDSMRLSIGEANARVVFEARTEGITGLHLHPSDVGGAILSIDETSEPMTWDDWPWAGPAWRDHVKTDVVHAIIAVEIEATDPETMARRWSEVLGIEDRLDEATIALDDSAIRFLPLPAESTRGEGVSGIVFATEGPSKEFELCGCSVRLAPR